MTTNTPDDANDQASLDNTQSPLASDPNADAAANVVRDKLSRIYAQEPEAATELAKADSHEPRSKHQEFMHSLGNSGKDLATIQTEWHDYYQSLPAADKHQVWQEFYASQPSVTGQSMAIPDDTAQVLAKHKQQAKSTSRARKATTKAKPPKKLRDSRSAEEVQAAIRHKVTAGGKLEAKHHIQSLIFGLGMGMLVLLVFLFSFFNEVIIAPFIQPSRVTAATPLIVSSNSVAPTPNPEVIIPKINVEIPVNYSGTSTNEAEIENDLESGVVHYPTTAVPGQTGNAAFFGHSSNNIFNKGKYKFAFVLLHTLVPGDTFYLTYNSKVYVYKVISKTVVEPSEVSVLNPVPGQTATATLITCDPPGTSLHRLVVVGQQISPDPSGNSESTATPTQTSKPAALPGNGPTLWGRLSKTFVGKSSIIFLLLVAVMVALRWLSRGAGNLKATLKP